MKIKTGEKELFESETFLVLGLGETVITLGNGPAALKIIFDFVNGEKQDIKWKTVDNKSLKVILTNWDSHLGTTLTQPVEIGTFKNRRLFLLFNVSKVGQEGDIRDVTVSLYLGEEVQGGQN